MWRSLGACFSWIVGIWRFLWRRLCFPPLILFKFTLYIFNKMSITFFLTIYMFLGCLWIRCMSLLFSLVNSFKYMLVYSNLWYSMDSHVRILGFMCKCFGLCNSWRMSNGMSILSLTWFTLVCFQMSFHLDFFMSFGNN